MSGLKQLLIDLGKDADLAEQYEKDPEAVMESYGLEPNEIAAMLKKDIEELARLSGLSNLKANGNVQAYDYD